MRLHLSQHASRTHNWNDYSKFIKSLPIRTTQQIVQVAILNILSTQNIMEKKAGRTQEIRVYLDTQEKDALLSKATASNQKLSTYVRNCLTRRMGKIVVTKDAIASRVVLSKIKQSAMMLKTIAEESNDTTNGAELLGELEKLMEIVDDAIMASITNTENDSSNLS
jgi:hypothetical protein